MHYVEIKGSAFLWHQVRCMMAVLFLVGDRREEPGIVAKLLDLTETPRKPGYSLASELPLVLYDCVFKAEDCNWVQTKFNEEKLWRIQ